MSKTKTDQTATRRPKGLGTVESRTLSDGTTVYRARRRVDDKNVYGAPRLTRLDAERDLRGLRPQSVKATEMPTLSEWAHQAQNGRYGTRKIAPSTHETNETIRLRYIEGSAMGRKKLDKITRKDVQSFVDGLKLHSKKTPASPAYTRRVYAFVSKLFTLAMEEGLISETPCRGIDLPKVVAERDNCLLPTSYIKQLLNPTSRLEHMLLVLVTTGMRASEIVNLRWRDLDPSSGQMRIPGTKTAASNAWIQVPDKVLGLLGGMDQVSEWVFPTASGKQMSRRNLLRDFKRWAKGQGLPPTIRLHDLRGTYVTMLIETGADPKTVQTMARHTDIRTTMRHYARSRKSVQADAISRVVSAIEGDV
jgi:integrase